MIPIGQAARGADIVLHSFDDYHSRFRAITRRTRERFDRRDWDGIRRHTVARLELHDRAVAEALEVLAAQLGDHVEDPELWARMKLAFSRAILGLHDFELAQTFFNSLSRRVFPHVGVDLAAANIFAGDMLLKNFGVTRHGRVVFYDYDELCPLVQCNFREFPPPRDAGDEMASEPWFSVGPDDVFPEELRRFVKLPEHLWRLLEEHHGDLFDVGFWRRTQADLRGGEIIDFFPYTGAQRLRPPSSANG